MIALAGSSGSGKTTLAEKLIRRLSARGFRVAYLKHDAHRFEMDRPGKDTWRASRAGAATVSIASAESWAWLQRGAAPGIGRLVRMALRAADWCVIEGYHGSRFPKVLVVRDGVAVRVPRPRATVVATYGDPVPPEAIGGVLAPHFGWRQVDRLCRHLFPSSP